VAKRAPESLTKYAKMRDFAKTPEPSGATTKSKASKKLRFVVQMHRATRLHYDFRLEDEGVLKSWAIPRGPSFDPAEKRFAAHVEDHPLDYRDFEGIIPKGNYGAGEVIVWDRGTYRLLEGTSTTAQIAKGSVKFELFGISPINALCGMPDLPEPPPTPAVGRFSAFGFDSGGSGARGRGRQGLFLERSRPRQRLRRRP